MNQRSNKKDEQGMVMIFVITVIFTLIVLLGLFLDVGTLMIAKRDREKTAQLVSSEAISVYNRDINTELSTRGAAARTKGEELANTNLNLQFAKSFFKDSSAQQQIDLFTKGETGNLVPGIWYFSPVDIFDVSADGSTKTCKAILSGHHCPCENDTWNGPCFRPIDGWTDTLATSINAFSSELYTPDNNKLKTTFMGITGQKELSIHSQSTIALRPLNVVVLLDLSRFVDEETHIPYEIAGLGTNKTNSEIFNPARFAYELDTNNIPQCSNSENNTMLKITIAQDNTIIEPELSLTCRRNPASDPTSSNNNIYWNRWITNCDNSILGGNFTATNWYNSIFNWPTKSIPPQMFYAQRPLDYPVFYHSKLDYRCLNINFKKAGVDNIDPYLVDLERSSAYRGPEPLTTFMQATRESIKKIKERNLRGDSISIIGFDWDAQIEPRRIGPFNPIEDNSDFNTQLVDRFDTAFDANAPDAHYQKLKTFYESTALVPRNGNRYLSIPFAIDEAYKILKSRPNFTTSDNMIILLTTGLTNCYKSDPSLQEQTCGQDANHFESSINETINYASNILAKNKVLLHTLIRSPRVKPLSKVVKQGPTCIPDENLPGLKMADSYNFSAPTDPVTPLDKQTGSFTVASGLKINQSFQLPNNLAKASFATGGVWAPVRPKCDWSGVCNNTKASEELTKCSSNTATPSIIDADKNLLCDLNCLDQDSQVKRYINNMFDLTPLLPVGEGMVVN